MTYLRAATMNMCSLRVQQTSCDRVGAVLDMMTRHRLDTLALQEIRASRISLPAIEAACRHAGFYFCANNVCIDKAGRPTGGSACCGRTSRTTRSCRSWCIGPVKRPWCGSTPTCLHPTLASERRMQNGWLVSPRARRRTCSCAVTSTWKVPSGPSQKRRRWGFYTASMSSSGSTGGKVREAALVSSTSASYAVASTQVLVSPTLESLTTGSWFASSRRTLRNRACVGQNAGSWRYRTTPEPPATASTCSGRRSPWSSKPLSGTTTSRTHGGFCHARGKRALRACPQRRCRTRALRRTEEVVTRFVPLGHVPVVVGPSSPET